MAALSRSDEDVLDKGKLHFTIESRVLRELGERLVKQPEVALLELVKNAYDADASVCEIVDEAPTRIVVSDDGHGMTLKEFRGGWMRIGTSAKEASDTSREYARTITGEKGIGRFAVRFLGKHLHLETVALDKHHGSRTRLVAEFNWPVFDQDEDLGLVQVPYQLTKVDDDVPLGTRLTISKLRSTAKRINYDGVRTGAIGVVTPYQALLKGASEGRLEPKRLKRVDPGFALRIKSGEGNEDEGDLADTILEAFVLRAVLTLQDDRLRLAVYRNGEKSPSLKISDRYVNRVGPVYADIRYFPQQRGTFSGLSVDGRRAKRWVKTHSGVAVFDRAFRVHPYGLESDDWLSLSADTAKRERKPRSSLALKHFPMNEATSASTQLNYMLRLPYSQQLVGIVQVKGRRTKDSDGDDDTGLVAAADREGFVNNLAFRNLVDIVRGAVEAIASVDRELQLEQEERAEAEALKRLRTETRAAIKEIESNPAIPKGEKARIVKHLAEAQEAVEEHDERSRNRESALEVMSLLGVVAGYMTHEFGAAFAELEKARDRITKLARRDESFKQIADAIEASIESLREFVTYSQGYIHGTTTRPAKPYQARSRLQRIVRVFGKYASDRGIDVQVQVDADVIAPLVPVSLYDGVALNLFTNALKAVTAKAGEGKRVIAFRAWNENDNHFLEVSDTGIGIPSTFRKRVFEPLFTTTATNQDPLGSGMGLGLSLVKRGVESFGGRVDVVDPPAGFTTCVKIRLPISEESE